MYSLLDEADRRCICVSSSPSVFLSLLFLCFFVSFLYSHGLGRLVRSCRRPLPSLTKD
ncbi:hypothetical protein FOXYSP1_21097 [Fusarium oxysporum f. sp. phaseoli]